MKNIPFFLLIAAGLALLLGAEKHVCSSSDQSQCSMQNAAIKKAILQTHDKIVAAAEKIDAEAMFNYILENNDGCIVQDGQLMVTREEALDTTKRNFEGIKTLDYQFDQRHVKVLCPTMAILTAAGKTMVTLSDGQSFTTPFANSSVFVLQDGVWKIIHGHHSTPNPQ